MTKSHDQLQAQAAECDSYVDRSTYDQTNPTEDAPFDARIIRCIQEIQALSNHPEAKAKPDHKRGPLVTLLHKAAWNLGEARHFQSNGLLPNPVSSPIS